MKGSAFLPIIAAGITPMILIGLILVGSTLGLVLWRPPVLWTDQFGSPNATSEVSGMTAGASGIYVTGYLSSNGTSLGHDFIKRYGDDGGVMWTRMIENSSGLIVNGIAVGSDGIYVAGSGFRNDTLLKYDFNGRQSWIQYLEPGIGISSIFAREGVVYAAGDSGHPLTNQTFTGPRISYIREYDSRGSIIWTSEFSNSTNILSSVLGIYASASRVFILTGLSLFACNLDGSQLWSYSFGAPGFISPFSVFGDVTGVYVSGTVKSSIRSFPTGFLTMFDSMGNIPWNAAFESPDKGGLGITSVSADPSGIYVSMVSGSGT